MSLLTSIISAVSATRVISNRDQQVSNKLVLLSLTIVLLQLLAGPAAAQFTKLHDFESFFGDSEPVGGVAISGTKLFGTTERGAGFWSTLWGLDVTTHAYERLHQFSFGGGTIWSYLVPEPSTLSIVATCLWLLLGFRRVGRRSCVQLGS